MPSQTAIRRIYKPLLFIVCLLPFLALVAGGFADTGYIRSGPLANFTLGADPTAYVLHKLGEWGLKFLIVTLMVTPARVIFHQGWLISFRRMLGLFAFFYVTLHFSTWLILDQGLYWSGILVDIGKRPYITIGFLAFLLLIPLALTSTNKMMRRLGKRWQKLHRLIYVITLLGVWHFYWQVKKDVREPLVYFAIVVLLLAWRYWHARSKRLQAQAAA